MTSNNRFRRKSESDDAYMTPMVDVTFLLLIFFMVTASFQLQRAMQVPKPQSSESGLAADVIDQEQIGVLIDSTGSFFVTTTQWERGVVGKQSLVSALKDALQDSPKSVLLAVKVDEMARLDSLVEVLDAGATAGLDEIRVTQISQL